MSLDQSLVVPEHPGDRRRHRQHDPVGSRSRRMLAELWTRDRNRSMSLVATSQRRRSVRSRRHQTSPSMGGLPDEVGADELDELPSRRGLDPELDGGADALVPDALERRRRRARGPRGGGSRARPGRRCRSTAMPKIRSAAGLAHTRMSLGVGHDDGIGQLQDQTLKPRRFHCPFPTAAPEASARGRGLYPGRTGTPSRTRPKRARVPGQSGRGRFPGGARATPSVHARWRGRCRPASTGPGGPPGTPAR